MFVHYQSTNFSTRSTQLHLRTTTPLSRPIFAVSSIKKLDNEKITTVLALLSTLKAFGLGRGFLEDDKKRDGVVLSIGLGFNWY